MLQFKDIDLGAVTVLLCDADGNTFPSEEPAFVASTSVVNAFLRGHGVERQVTAEELRRSATGKNFRSIVLDLAMDNGIPVDPTLVSRYRRSESSVHALSTGLPVLSAVELEHWVEEEKRVVTAHLSSVLTPDPRVTEPLRELSHRFILAAVSSSATSRIAACFAVTGLAALFPETRRFSAEDSLPAPTSKPDPAIYTFASARLGIRPDQGLAIEDSVPGAHAAVAAGCPTIGNVLFVSPTERAARIEALRAAGVLAVIFSWWELVDLVNHQS